MKYRMLAIDLDGTTVKMRNRISKANIREIKKALESDIKVIIATGRSISAIEKAAKKLHVINYNLPVIGFNGGVVYDFGTQKTLLENNFSAQQAAKIFALCQQYNLIAWAYAADDDKKAYVNNLHSPLIKWMSFYTKRKKILVEREYQGSSVYKFVINGHQEDLEKFKNKVNKDKFSIFQWSYRKNNRANIEISPPNVDKQQALAFLAKQYNIKPSEVIAVGDGENDKQMLTWAGLGIAMGNAKEEVKAIANEVTGHHRKSGLALALKKHLSEKNNEIK